MTKPCVWCEHPFHAGRCTVMFEADEDSNAERCGCAKYSDVPPMPPTMADLERRLSARVDRLKRCEAVNAPEVILAMMREHVEKTRREIRERAARGAS